MGKNTIKLRYDHVIALLKTFLWHPIVIGIKIKTLPQPPQRLWSDLCELP